LGSLEPLHRLRSRRPIFTHNNENYVVMHCTGYVKNVPPAGIDAPASSCLVAIARLQTASMPVNVEPIGPHTQFTMRIAEDGKITFVDQRATDVLSLPTDQMLGRQWWQIVHPEEEAQLRDALQRLMHDQSIQIKCRVRTDKDFIPCSIEAYKFLNPYSEQFEYIVATLRVPEPPPTNGIEEWNALNNGNSAWAPPVATTDSNLFDPNTSRIANNIVPQPGPPSASSLIPMSDDLWLTGNPVQGSVEAMRPPPGMPERYENMPVDSSWPAVPQPWINGYGVQ
jgi:hypothetical protein